MRSEDVDMVFFDLDGTLINPRKRLHTLFVELSGSQIGFDEYWKCKDKGLNQAQMLEHIGYRYSCREFNKRWLEEIERKDLLSLDEVFTDVPPLLESLRTYKIKMFIVTNRQSYENLEWELLQFGISGYFDAVISTFQKCSKDEAVVKLGLCTENSVFVGDSEEDMNAARALGINGILIHRDSTGGCVNMDSKYNITNLSELRGILF